jgi:hypothetical protein
VPGYFFNLVKSTAFKTNIFYMRGNSAWQASEHLQGIKIPPDPQLELLDGIRRFLASQRFLQKGKTDQPGFETGSFK